jgi:outer membrane protein assembly factor BamB
MAIGYRVETIKDDSELDKQLDNLRFMCTTPSGLNEQKYNYYKEKLLNQYQYVSSNDDIVIEPEKEEMMIPVEMPSKMVMGGPKDTPWAMQSHDLHHTGRSPYSTAHVDGLEKWRFYTDDWFDESPIIDSDGTIYAGSGRELYAINPDGSLKWMYQTGGSIIGSTPAIAEDGTIYFCSWDDYLHAINPDGTRKWRFCAHDDIASSPAIAEDGTIYFGTMLSGNNIYAVNPNGTEKWHYTTGYPVTSDPAIGDDGTVYIGSCDDYLYAMYPNGTLRWRFKTGDEIHSNPSIADDGTVYIGSNDGYLYALYPNNGTMKWKTKTGWGMYNGAAIGTDGIIYVGDKGIHAIYPENGTKKWTFNLGSDWWVALSSPAISADGTIYIGIETIHTIEQGDIIAINSDGTERWRKKIANNWVESSPSIGEDGTVYIGSTSVGGGYLHAFGPVESNQPPGRPMISGETNGWAGKSYWYTFKSIDPDRNPIRFYIDWGDGNEGWTTYEHASGEKCYYDHAWSERDEYTIRCKVKDVMGAESEWSELVVSMPRNRGYINIPFLRFLQQHINLFPILRHLLRL